MVYEFIVSKKARQVFKNPVSLATAKACPACGTEHLATPGDSVFHPRLGLLLYSCQCGCGLEARHFYTDETPIIEGEERCHRSD